MDGWATTPKHYPLGCVRAHHSSGYDPGDIRKEANQKKASKRKLKEPGKKWCKKGTREKQMMLV